MVSHTSRKVRPNKDTLRREKRGVYTCYLCGGLTTSQNGLIDRRTRIATCGRCIDRLAEPEVANG